MTFAFHFSFIPKLCRFFFTYLLVGLAVYFLSTGVVGFFAVYAFLRKIYSAVKID